MMKCSWPSFYPICVLIVLTACQFRRGVEVTAEVSAFLAQSLVKALLPLRDCNLEGHKEQKLTMSTWRCLSLT